MWRDKEEQTDINILACDLDMCLLTYFPLELIKCASSHVYFLLEQLKLAFLRVYFLLED